MKYYRERITASAANGVENWRIRTFHRFPEFLFRFPKKLEISLRPACPFIKKSFTVSLHSRWPKSSASYQPCGISESAE